MRFESARFGTPDWDEAAAEYAATPSGHDKIMELVEKANREGNFHLVGAGSVALSAGTRLRMAADDVRDMYRAHTTSHAAPTEPARATEPVGGDTSRIVTFEDGTTWDPGTPSTTAGEHWSIAEGGTRWHEGGCGAFAVALQQRWPHLKIACELYNDHGAESVAHAWAYDPDTNTRFHIFGAEQWEPTESPDYDPDSHRVVLDQTPEDVRALFGGRNMSEDTIMDGMEVACELFDPNYEPPGDDFDDSDRSHLYY